MLEHLKPGNSANAYLTQSEYDSYCSMFKKQDDLFTCN